jgi:hypothetical protein
MLVAAIGFVMLAACFMDPAMTALMEHFPTEVRYSGFAHGYNLGAGIFGGVTPLIAAWLIPCHGIFGGAELPSDGKRDRPPSRLLPVTRDVSLSAGITGKKKCESRSALGALSAVPVDDDLVPFHSISGRQKTRESSRTPHQIEKLLAALAEEKMVMASGSDLIMWGHSGNLDVAGPAFVAQFPEHPVDRGNA